MAMAVRSTAQAGMARPTAALWTNALATVVWKALASAAGMRRVRTAAAPMDCFPASGSLGWWARRLVEEAAVMLPITATPRTVPRVRVVLLMAAPTPTWAGASVDMIVALALPMVRQIPKAAGTPGIR